MKPIHPICADAVLPYKGQQICGVMHDGTHFYGTVTDVRDDHIYFGHSIAEPGTISSSGKRSKNKLNKKKKATVSAFGFPGYPAYPGYGYGGLGGAGFAVSLALIALLFAAPGFGLGFPY